MADTLIRRYLRDHAIKGGSHSHLISLAIKSDAELEQHLIDEHARLEAEALRLYNHRFKLSPLKRQLSKWLGWL